MKAIVTKKSAASSSDPQAFFPRLRFDGSATPVAERALGGLIRDHFANGRITATVAHHGGLTQIAYWGRQHDGAANFFQGALETGWNKLFRFYVNIGGRHHYPILNDSRLYPFGIASHDTSDGVAMKHDLLLLPDALVQRVRFGANPKHLSLRVGMVHQEAVTAIEGSNREWQAFVFDPRLNALITSCLDINPPPPVRPPSEDSLQQRALGPKFHDAPRETTWIGLGCDAPFTSRPSFHPRSKHYMLSDALKSRKGAFYLVFASTREALEKRLKELAKTVHQECDALVADYEKRLRARPRVDVGDPVLNSAFMQYPEMIESMKLPDAPGAARGCIAGYYVYGWDGMTPLMSSPLANEVDYPRASFRFFQETLDAKWGIPHQFSSQFKLKLMAAFPAQCQYIASLYHYVSITGDLALAKDVLPACKFILDGCRRNLVKDTGLVSGVALWPDFPEAMGEDGHDISSLNNSLLYQGLRAMEYLAQALGEATLAADCRDWARALRTSFVNYLYDGEKGYFISSCSSIDFKPRKHYCCQAIFWLTPFARELVSHAPTAIAKFMDQNLRSSKCLLSLPHWDTAWMAEGNQLGSSYPTSDYFYLHVHKLIGDDYALKAWLGDVAWFWRHHTAPEAFTPEADNEEASGPDNWGGKQCQACTAWYASLYLGLAGLDFDHEGLTVTPWGDRPVKINGLRLRGVSVDLKISGRGSHLGSLKLNGKTLPTSLRKISWKELKGKRVRLEIVRSTRAPKHPVIVRADGLKISLIANKGALLTARVGSGMSGEIVIQAGKRARILVNGQPKACPHDATTGTFCVPVPGDLPLEITAQD
jgi:hypothetical protein